MSVIRVRGEKIRQFILDRVAEHPRDIAKLTSARFHITRQAVNKHLHRLCEEDALAESGQTRNRVYKLRPLSTWKKEYALGKGGLAEDVIWHDDVVPQLGRLPDNVLHLWGYGFTEMFNNVLDHSEASSAVVEIHKSAVGTEMIVYDNGVGIFKRIQAALNLPDERHAVLELHKGKLTTDPVNHSGEGIFFTSRMFDRFAIMSGDVYFSHKHGNPEDWIFDEVGWKQGTLVLMNLGNHTARTTKKVFDQYASGENYGFNKTVVPVRLAKYGNENLVSRSQAKRLLNRVELFKTVVLDFSGVDLIGQAFADEVFRVFVQRHPGIELVVFKANSAIKRMIEHVTASR